MTGPGCSVGDKLLIQRKKARIEILKYPLYLLVRVEYSRGGLSGGTEVEWAWPTE